MNTETLLSGVRAVFDEHPEDVIYPIKASSEALTWLEIICRQIADLAHDPLKLADNPLQAEHIRRLAEAGAYLAGDTGQRGLDAHSLYRGRLVAAGLVAAE